LSKANQHRKTSEGVRTARVKKRPTKISIYLLLLKKKLSNDFDKVAGPTKEKRA
jgi:hypothetical protein